LSSNAVMPGDLSVGRATDLSRIVGRREIPRMARGGKIVLIGRPGGHPTTGNPPIGKNFTMKRGTWG